MNCYCYIPLPPHGPLPLISEEQSNNITYFIGPEHGILPVPTDEGSGAGLDFHDGNIQADQGQQTLHGIPVEAVSIVISVQGTQ